MQTEPIHPIAHAMYRAHNAYVLRFGHLSSGGILVFDSAGLNPKWYPDGYVVPTGKLSLPINPKLYTMSEVQSIYTQQL